MVLSVANRVSVAIGLLLLLFFVSLGVSFVLTKRMDEDVARLAGAYDPLREMVAEAETRLGDAAEALASHASERTAASRGRARRALGEFERTARRLAGLLSSAEATPLAERLSAQVAEIESLGAELLDASERQAADLGRLRETLQRTRQALWQATRDAIELGGEGVATRFEAARGLEAATDALLAAAEGAAEGEPASGAEVQAADAEFRRFAARYAEAASGEAERARLAQLGDDFAAAVGLARGIVELGGTSRALLRRLDERRASIVEVLDDEVDILASAVGGQRSGRADFATYTVLTYLILMSIFFAASGATMLLTRGIVRPLDELTAAVEAIAGGRLDHRVSVQSEDEIGRLAASFNRVAQNSQRAEEALRELALHDTLTRLPNRAYFQIRLAEALDNARRVNRMVAVHFLDLDHFKDINDTLGHPTGDKLLQHVAERIQACLRKADTVARLGGDEFAVIQTNLRHSSGIAVIARRLIDSLAKPYDLDGEQVFSGASVGITVFPHDGSDPDELLKNADLALYRAKQEGRNTYRLFDNEMNAEVQARKALEQDLRQALERSEIYLDYQPQIDIGSGRVIGAEALARWRHPAKGVVQPDEFIPVAEQSGLIMQLTELVLHDACSQIKAWQEQGLPALRVSVNLSAVDFKRKDLVPMVTRTLEETGADPACLELEITESMMMTDAEAAVADLNALKALGIKIAIDDFGTGFSSMNYLKQFPVDRLKIDLGFVRDVTTNTAYASITNAIINLGHTFDLKVIAEGVESGEQLDFLRQRQCDEAQGYCFSQPLSADQFRAFVEDGAAPGPGPAV